MCKQIRICLVLLWLAVPSLAAAQAPPPPAPPEPLAAPPVPNENPQQANKILLGAALFWDEQLSLTGTVACGTCHAPRAGGSDPRVVSSDSNSVHPGPDGVFGSADDIVGAAGVPQHDADGHYRATESFGLLPQVGARQAPPAVNAAYFSQLFWDGRAGNTLVDPDNGTPIIASGAALENQALGPLQNSAEMAHLGGVLQDVVARISASTPLALASDVPADWLAWINRRNYPALFAEVFGDSSVSAARVALAIASYERSLIADQTPFDAQLAGLGGLTAQENAGRQVFVASGCALCHSGGLLSDDRFHYIGVRPQAADPGRFAVTGLNPDRGAMRTPSLRNVELSAPYMADGRLTTLEEVIDFYDRGGDFTAANLPAAIRPLALSATEKANLAAFLRRPLTDPRVAAESGPFVRPTLFSESDRPPQVGASGRVGPLSGQIPLLIAIEPSLAGTRSFTVALQAAWPLTRAWVVIDLEDPLEQAAPQQASLFGEQSFAIDVQGNGSINVDLPNLITLQGQQLFLRVFVQESAGTANADHAVTSLAQFELLNVTTTLFESGFE